MTKTLTLITAALVTTSAAAGQQPIVVSSALDQYLRLLELDGRVSGTPLVYRPLSPRQVERSLSADSRHPWARRYALQPRADAPAKLRLRLLDPEARVIHNSAFPRSTNDGSLWAGRGLSTILSAGAQVAWGPVTAVLYPEITYARNRQFELAPVTFAERSPFAYPWTPIIDWPQRFGDGSLASAGWGQSGLRVDWRALTAGLSSENLWWGPGYRNAIVMSSTAPGFPHIDLGTGRPVATPIGEIEARAIWGALRKSAYFDNGPSDGRRFLTGLTIGYRPRFLPGLTLGLARVLYEEWPAGGLELGDLTLVLGTFFNPGGRRLPDGSIGNDLQDQLASLVARWVLPQSGFEAYVEWARNDFAGSLRDFLLEPEHSRGFTAGFQKTLPSGRGRWRLAGEVTTLGLPPTFLVRAEPTYYEHGFAVGGYTNKGQLIGAGIGPGANSQYLGLDRYTPSGRWGVFLERVRYNDDAVFARNVIQPTFPFGLYEYHQVDLTAGASVYRFKGSFDIGGSLELTRELNRNFQRRNDATNLKVELAVRWRGPTGRGEAEARPRPRSPGTRP